MVTFVQTGAEIVTEVALENEMLVLVVEIPAEEERETEVYPVAQLQDTLDRLSHALEEIVNEVVVAAEHVSRDPDRIAILPRV